MSELSINAVAAFNDNYIWVITHAGSAWVVDPGDCQPVLDYLAKQHLTLAGILITHHHGDHTGGVQALKQHFPAAQVVGNGNSPAAHLIEHTVSDGDTITVLGQPVQVIAVPGHTLDHLAYYCAPAHALFCGDTLFIGGCGRVFEGSYQQMFASLQRLAALPDTTQIYCAHEYTVSNLTFAVAAEQDSEACRDALIAAQALRAAGKSTVPASMATQRLSNPFLRADSIERFIELREWKNNF